MLAVTYVGIGPDQPGMREITEQFPLAGGTPETSLDLPDDICFPPTVVQKGSMIRSRFR